MPALLTSTSTPPSFVECRRRQVVDGGRIGKVAHPSAGVGGVDPATAEHLVESLLPPGADAHDGTAPGESSASPAPMPDDPRRVTRTRWPLKSIAMSPRCPLKTSDPHVRQRTGPASDRRSGQPMWDGDREARELIGSGSGIVA